MKPREKLLLFGILGFVGVFGLGFGLKTILTKPLKAADQRNAGLRGKLNKLKEERRAFFEAEDRVKSWTQRTFADSVDDASARSGAVLTQLILQSGLPETAFTRLPVGPRRIRAKGDMEIGWNIQGGGPLSNVINLLFLLQESPQIHRIESIVIGTADKSGQVKVHFKYLTLVVIPAPDVEPLKLPEITLENPKRQLYKPIVRRDILRPYIKRPLPPPAPAPPPTAPPPAPPPTPAPPGPETYRIVSLSDWDGQPEVHVRDLTANKTTAYKSGDELAGGAVVMVDYRALPMPGKPGLMSYSRVILKIDGEYWAVERGQTLADKYKLASEQLPPQLSQL